MSLSQLFLVLLNTYVIIWVYDHYNFTLYHSLPLIFLLLQRGDRFYTSESDVYRRQILTYKVDPRAVRVNLFYLR